MPEVLILKIYEYISLVLVITMSADDFAPDGARPSAGMVLATKHIFLPV